MPLQRPFRARAWLRTAFGGLLMGLANLVPGISGGTMLLAAGVYGDFIDSVAALTRLRARRRELLVLLCIAAAAAAAVLGLAGPVRDLVVHRRWVMYSLFIGLTLGGVPTLWRRVRPADGAVWLGAAAGFAGMALLALAQQRGAGGGALGGDGPVALVFAGAAGAASMVLPGVSGGYLLLVLGQYVRILDAVDRFGSAALAGEWYAALAPASAVLLPLALGLALGVALVSNLLRHLLRRYRRPTLGVLVGLLLGAVVGLWPFQLPAPSALAAPAAAGHAPLRLYLPDPHRAAIALVLVAVGCGCTLLVDRLGDDRGA